MPRPLTVLLAVAGVAAVPSAARADFYTPPAKLPAKHGKLLKDKRLTGPDVLEAGRRTDRVLYTSKGVRGRSVAVSGTITYPRGKAPKGGWPVITFAHGTTGIADQCAPSRLKAATPLVRGYTTYAFPLLNRWLKKGWAVARTDYEGLGTPGVHPYLIGTSEGRATLDIVRAVPGVDRRRVVISGHSQGGHAALWADALAAKYTPELRVRGTLAFAPESHTAEQAQALPALKAPSGLSGLAAMILRGAEVQQPSLDAKGLLSPRAAALYPTVDTECLGSLVTPGSFGAIAPADLVRSGADETALLRVLSANDSEDLTVRGPLRIEQGAADGTVFPVFTDQTVAAYREKGAKVDYDLVPGLDHTGIFTTASVQRAATKWVAKRLR